MALSEAVKEVMFMIQLLGSILIAVKYPVVVRVIIYVIYLWKVILLPNAIPSTWISGTSMLMSTLRTDLLR